MAEVKLPRLGETVEEGTITQWFKRVGDVVALDEPLFEVSTDKVDSEVPSPLAGVLTEIVANEGATVEVGAVIALVGDSNAASVANTDPPAVAAPTTTASVPHNTGAAGTDAVDTSVVAPVIPTSDSPNVDVGVSAAAASLVLSPVVRKLISENHLDPSQIAGSGKGGRVTRADVETYLAQNRSTDSPQESQQPQQALRPHVSTSSLHPGGRETLVPLSNIRRITGEHMVRSKELSPHVLTAVEVDFEAVEKVRRKHRQNFKAQHGFSLTYLPFIARAVCDSLASYPHINSTVGANELVVHNYVNLAIAVDLNFEGLLAPVVVDANRKRLVPIAEEIADLSRRARSKQLHPDEMSGGTFTITNPGQWGTMMQFPIINQPQVAILSTDGIRRRPVVVTALDGSEAIAIHSVGVLALAWDHRAFDGAYVAAFLDNLRRIIETRDWHSEIV